MSGPISVNPQVLRWARTSLGLSQEEVAQRMNKKARELDTWERGEASPTYIQLEKLAYEIYKRPIALFFFPEVPEEETIEQEFRTLPKEELLRLSPWMRYLLRKARVLQLNLAELYGGVNPAKRRVLHDLDFASSVAATDMAKQVRTYLGIELDQQQAWKNTEDALKHWREVLEECGVFVFKDTFKPPGKKRVDTDDIPFSGFCLYDPDFPIIYVNNNNTKSRQIFTLFHELAHLLMHTGGIDTRQDNYIEHMIGDNRRIEVLCNLFAAEFLVPSYDFEARSASVSIDDYAIENWASLYCVSRETILRRLLDQGRVRQQDYEQQVQQWSKDQMGSEGTGGDYYRTKGAYLGERYIELVFSHYHQGHISVEQAADYLGARAKNVPRIEEWLFNQGTRT